MLVHDQPNPELLLQGIDSLYVSFDADTASSLLDWDELAFRKEQARTLDKGFEEIELGSERFALLPYGRNPYTYVLQNASFEIRLRERPQPTVYVQFYSEALWHQGFMTLIYQIQRWFASLSILEKKQTISRADWSFDYHLANVDFDIDSFVSRASKDATYRDNRTVQTFRFGQGQIVLRVYDKVAEIAQQSNKIWLHELWGRCYDVWRIEFQVRGDRLKQAGIHTAHDLSELQSGLLEDLASSHTTLRHPNGDSNRSRWPLHPLWTALLSDIGELPKTGVARAWEKDSSLQWRLERQVLSTYGNLKGMAALLTILGERRDPVTLGELLTKLLQLTKRHHTPKLWDNEVHRRVQAFELGKW